MLQKDASMHMQMVQCNAWLHFYPQIPRKEVRAATTLLYLNVHCCTGTYRTNPATISSYAYSIWECKCMIAMHELHIPPNFITSRVMPQVEKIYKFTNKAKFRSYLASVSFWNLMEAIQITKLKRVDHITTFTCLHRRSRTWANHGLKMHHLFTNIPQHQNKYTSK